MTFFAKLKPLDSIMFTAEYRRIATLDYDDDDQLAEQQIALLQFFREHQGRWARYHGSSNGFVYASDSDAVVIVSEEWFSDIANPRTELTGRTVYLNEYGDRLGPTTYLTPEHAERNRLRTTDSRVVKFNEEIT